MPEPEPTRPAAAADWESFYANYRKPGYVEGFEITSKLGGGMFGLVFKATRQSIGKDYAIKFLKVDDGEVRRAVLAELAQVQHFAQIDHPNLVSIEDRGEVDGIPFLVMAFAGAETMRDRLSGEPQARDELLRLFLQACRGTAALHEHSLVHFDLKPANVFIKGGVARVGDYGLSKLVTHSRGSLSMGRGTPYYMAPEMLQSRGDHRSDVYSLGVMLYEVLCGDVPFKGESEWEVLRKHEKAAIEFPEHVGARERAVVERCMAKDPADRFQSLHDLVDVLGAPVGVGAAAWQDARQGAAGGAGAAAAAGPAAAAGVGKTGAGDDNYAGLAQSTREAYTDAGQKAREAVSRARDAARRAARDANTAIRGAVLRSRGKRRSFPLGRLLVVLGVVVLVFVFLSFFLARVGLAGDVPRSIAHEPQRDFVPAEFRGAVSMDEPGWVGLAQRNLAGAREQLQQHLGRWLSRAPVDGVRRQTVADWPQFRSIVAPSSARVDVVMAELQSLLAAEDYDETIAERLGGHGLWVLQLAADLLQDDGTPASLQNAQRLHRFLTETTGFQGIELYDDAGLTPLDRLGLNSGIGSLWSWFLHEVGSTQRSWDAYLGLQDG